jgi:hypothetical protein
VTEQDNPVLYQLTQSGYLPDFYEYQQNGQTLLGTVDLSIVERLLCDTRFANGVFYGLHRDVGHDLIDFRSYRGTLGKGSLQLVIDQVTGLCYADIDIWNPYADLVGVVGHLFGEVIPHRVKRWFS